VSAVQANLSATGATGPRVAVAHTDVLRWLVTGAEADLVLCDPPYDWTEWDALLSGVRRLLEAGPGLAVLETDHRLELGDGWQTLTVKQYGGTVVTVARPATKGGM
jgi:16S rRNA G966 N2-methylase RsmD